MVAEAANWILTSPAWVACLTVTLTNDSLSISPLRPAPACAAKGVSKAGAEGAICSTSTPNSSSNSACPLPKAMYAVASLAERFAGSCSWTWTCSSASSFAAQLAVSPAPRSASTIVARPACACPPYSCAFCNASALFHFESFRVSNTACVSLIKSNLHRSPRNSSSPRGTTLLPLLNANFPDAMLFLHALSSMAASLTSLTVKLSKAGTINTSVMRSLELSITDTSTNAYLPVVCNALRSTQSSFFSADTKTSTEASLMVV
eukprot:CAMPEP_0180697122 /NCGR_PEP_ID=MMETSP1038_2-20121128/3335_1 /TAXON_ID=632150 /ORGANISM="Azadinium spinosum, Strain 3D9" /LENGTH=261 /DNA_ID=CAMNT_0022728629 /DNA_START=1087 /DNA_END=1872 /DNA_ORIENTATION=-